MPISFSYSGSFDKTEKFLKRTSDLSNALKTLEHYGKEGVAALQHATPSESGETARAWYYEVKRERGSYSIIWGNTHIEDGRPIAVLLQHGHATRTGGFVPGRDYINPALKPIFDRMVADGWKVVTS
jgi:predicted class III extradiol MEMO1 family dioxygenase